MSNLNYIRILIFGDNEKISSERYFLTATTFVATIFLIILCCIHIIMNLKTIPLYLAASASMLMAILYVAIRVQNYIKLTKIALTIFGLLLLDFTWYSKYLSNGPLLYFILIFGALVIWVWEGTYLKVLITFYFINIAALFYIDYNAVASFMQYPDPKIRSIDIYVSFTLFSSLLIFLLLIVKNEYLREKEKAEMSDKLKSAFLANMAHEIRTPMNGILGFTTFLKNKDLKVEEQQEYLEIIEKSGVRMLNLIDNIVDVSKIEAGLMSTYIRETNINEQIEYIYTFFKPEVDAKGNSFRYKKTLSHEEAVILTDQEKLFSIFSNLLKNANKYTAEGQIEYGYSLTESTKGTKELQFFIKDTGIGIPKDRQEAIFKRFVQADIDDTNARQGAGLGLTITKAYVELLGGKIWVESTVNNGSTFYFTLPYKTSEKNKSRQRNLNTFNMENMTKRLKILIVEDDLFSEKLIELTVKKISREIIKTKTGIEAVEATRNHPDIDLILMDIRMPLMNGYEATKLIREFNKDVIIIAQTAYAQSGDRQKSIESGCNDYITKPIDREEMLSMIQFYFEKQLT